MDSTVRSRTCGRLLDSTAVRCAPRPSPARAAPLAPSVLTRYRLRADHALAGRPLAARRSPPERRRSRVAAGVGQGTSRVALTEREAAFPFVKKVMMPRKSGKQFDAAYTLADEISADDFPVAAL